MTRAGSYRPILLVGLVLVRGMSKLVVPVLCRRLVGGEFLVPVFCVGRDGTESRRAGGRLIVIFEIVVPVLGRSTFGRTGAKCGLVSLDRTRGGPRLINEVIVPVFGHVVRFENTFGRRQSRIGTVEVEILVPVLRVAGCGNISEEKRWAKLGRGVTNREVFGPLLPSVRVSNTPEIPRGRPSVEIAFACLLAVVEGDEMRMG